jgi:DNA-binding FadR family transcriptional regulator
MGAHRTLEQLRDEMVGSRHRGARVLRFIYRNRKKHRAIIKALQERDRYGEELAARRHLERQGVPAKEAKRRARKKRRRHG